MPLAGCGSKPYASTPATELLGVRVNLWTSAIALVAAVAVLVVRSRSRDDTQSAADELVDDVPADG